MREWFCRSLCAGLVLSAALLGPGQTSAEPVWALDPTPADTTASVVLSTPVEWLRCWHDRGGLAPDHVEAALELFGAANLVVDLSYRSSTRRAGVTSSGPSRGGVLVEVLVEAQIPIWRAQTLETRLETGRPLSLTHGVNACLPYPIKSLAVSAQPLVRGRTAVLRIETDRQVSCHARYLGRTESCYADGHTVSYVPLGISPLVVPGRYPVEVELISDNRQLAFTVPLDIAAGGYGLQVITPPAQLRGLISSEVAEAEEQYLAHWRALRSPERLWSLPLAPPLNPPISITAGFGDRRSYGGLLSGYHSGVDFRAGTGVPVLAPSEGVVVMAEALTWRGNAVLLDHGWGLITGYWHLSQIDVQVGDRVNQGERFALVGNSGLSTGSHLHFEVWVNGISVDGRQWLSGEGLELLTSPVIHQEG